MNRIVAAGSGRMGCSMAIAFAYAGKTVDLLDLKIRDDADVTAHRDAITKELNGHLGTLARIGVLGESDVDRILARIRVHSRADAAPVLATAELVLEGVPE
ncbi:MAG: 3-hydroxyacyl-CoA dehydrogenase NAD-binding domain-containing protein, partial [Burkholderiaceae bacterium]